MVTTFDPFFVTGHPKPKGSWTPLRTRDGKIKFRHASNKTAKWCVDAKEQVAILWRGPILEGPIFVDLLFLLPRPKTVSRPYPTGKYDGDGDKLTRAMLDAMTGIVYVDDSQVIDWPGKKRYTDGTPGVWVTISTDL